MISSNLASFKDVVKRRNWMLGAAAALLIAITAFNWALSTYWPDISTPVEATTSLIVFTVATFFVASLANRLSVPWIRRLTRNAEPENRILFSKLVGVMIFAVALVTVLWRLGVNGQNIALVLGFTATGFALSIRDIVASYLAWFVLLTKRPFRIGELIRIEGYEGEVKHIGTFYVVLDENPSSDEDYYKVPTTLFVQKPIRNFNDGPLRDTMSVTFDKRRGWKSKLDRLRTTLDDDFEQPTRVLIDVQDKSFVVTVKYAYRLADKVEVKRQVAKAMFEELGTKPT